MDIQEIGKMNAFMHLQAYNEIYGEGNIIVLDEYGDLESEENKNKEHTIEAKGFRIIDENMFGDTASTGKIAVFLKNEIEIKKLA